jgi:hypothetical protein
MRTTVTLDPDVEHLLRQEVRKSGMSFKVVLNRAVRESLAAPGGVARGKPFRVKARRMGLRAGIDAGGLNRLLDEVEVETFLGKQTRRS